MVCVKCILDPAAGVPEPAVLGANVILVVGKQIQDSMSMLTVEIECLPQTLQGCSSRSSQESADEHWSLVIVQKMETSSLSLHHDAELLISDSRRHNKRTKLNN